MTFSGSSLGLYVSLLLFFYFLFRVFLLYLEWSLKFKYGLLFLTVDIALDSDKLLLQLRGLMRSNQFQLVTTWKMSVFGVFLVRIFPHSDWIRTDMEHLFAFTPNAGKYGPKKLRIRTLFMQCVTQNRFAYQLRPKQMESILILVKKVHTKNYIFRQIQLRNILLGF